MGDGMLCYSPLWEMRFATHCSWWTQSVSPDVTSPCTLVNVTHSFTHSHVTQKAAAASPSRSMASKSSSLPRSPALCTRRARAHHFDGRAGRRDLPCVARANSSQTHIRNVCSLSSTPPMHTRMHTHHLSFLPLFLLASSLSL